MDIVERLRTNWDFDNDDKLIAAEEIEGLRKEIERLSKRVELLEGYLNGALNVIEGFVHCDTTEARKALEGNE